MVVVVNLVVVDMVVVNLTVVVDMVDDVDTCCVFTDMISEDNIRQGVGVFSLT